MSTPTKDRLIWIRAALQKLKDSDWLRYEGNQAWSEATAELDDVIRTFVDNSGLPAPVTLEAMTQDQVDGVVARIQEITAKVSDLNSIVTAINAHTTEQAEASDVAVMTAITASQADIIAACAPAVAE